MLGSFGRQVSNPGKTTGIDYLGLANWLEGKSINDKLLLGITHTGCDFPSTYMNAIKGVSDVFKLEKKYMPNEGNGLFINTSPLPEKD